jgi:hypothetical protein
MSQRLHDPEIVQVARDGHDVFAARRAGLHERHGYATDWLFSGTSASAPHVAGTIALLKQLDSSLTHSTVEQAIRNGALADTATGAVPNESWGMGKLRAANSVLKADKVAPTFTVLATRHPVMSTWLVATVIPSERLQAPPVLSSTAVSVGPVVAQGEDLYTSTFLAPKTGTSFSLSVSGKDLAGNGTSTSVSVTY